MAKTVEDATNKVIDMARMVVEYRNRVGALGFQLEKADYWFDQLSQALERLDEIETTGTSCTCYLGTNAPGPNHDEGCLCRTAQAQPEDGGSKPDVEALLEATKEWHSVEDCEVEGRADCELCNEIAKFMAGCTHPVLVSRYGGLVCARCGKEHKAEEAGDDPA